MKRISITLCLLLISVMLFPAFEYLPGNVKIKALRYNTTAIKMGIENALINPASAAYTYKSDIALSYENLFGFTHAFSLAGSYKTQYGTVGGKYTELFVLGDYADADSVISTGSRLHTERTVSITYGVPLADMISFGTNINMLYLEQADNGANMYYTVDLGLLSTIYRRWNIGIAARNITNSYITGTLTSYRYYFDRAVSAGISFEPYDDFITSFDVSKSADYPTSFGGGVNYGIMKDVLTLRFGVRSYPMEYSGGLELMFGQFSLDYTYAATQYLNGMHLVQLNYHF